MIFKPESLEPIIFYSLLQDDSDEVEDPKKRSAFEKQRNVLLLSIAYAASIGGTGVITGNPSNLVIMEVSIVDTK